MIYEAYRSMTSNQLSYLHHRDLDYPEHMHYSFEIHLVTEGVMRCTVSGTEYLLHPGEAVLILPNEPHEYMHPGPTAGVTVVFSVDYVADFTNATRGSRLKTSLFHPDPALLSDDLTEVNRFLQVGRLNMLCGSALAECGLEEAERRNETLMLKIIEYVAAHYQEEMSLHEMARALGYQYNYLSGFINSSFACSYSDIVGNYRVMNAMPLMQNGTRSITAVSAQCGFSSVRSFNRAFRSVFGISPREYIEQRRGS